MKRTLLSIAFVATLFQVKAQTVYDFGTSSQAAVAPLYATGATAPQWPLDAGTPYLPVASVGTIGIVSRNNTAGNVQLANGAIAGLTGGYLKFTTGSTTSTDLNSKFGVYNHVGATNVATATFKLHVPSTSATGSYVFAFGNGAAATGAGTGPNVGQNLVVLRFAIGTGVVMNHYSSGAYVGNDFIGGANSISKDATHTLAVFMNNEATTQSYAASGTNNLAAGTYDVWVDGVKVLAGAATAGLPSGGMIDDMNFINSVGNATTSTVYFDDYVYSNALTPSVLPVTISQPLSAKVTGNQVNLSWATSSEQNSDRFEVLHSGNGKDFTKIGSRETKSPNGAKYGFTHLNVASGANYYKLIQVDKNGSSEEFSPVVATVSLSKADFNIYPKQQSVVLAIDSEKPVVQAQIKLIDIMGRVVVKQQVNITTGINNFSIPVGLGKGIYVATVNGEHLKLSKKFIQN